MLKNPSATHMNFNTSCYIIWMKRNKKSFIFVAIVIVCLLYLAKLAPRSLEEKKLFLPQRPAFRSEKKFLYGPSVTHVKDFEHLYLYEDNDVQKYIRDKLPDLLHKKPVEKTDVPQLPSAIIASSPHCSSASLLRFLSHHPYVIIPDHEVHYFDVATNFSKGLDWYKSQFPSSSPGHFTIDTTNAYFSGAGVPEKVNLMNETIRIVLMVCDPLKRIDSIHAKAMFLEQDEHNAGTYEEFLYSLVNRDGQVKDYSPYIRNGMYHEAISKWLEVFPSDQILIVDEKEFTREPFEVMKKMETFLGLQHYFTPDQFKHKMKIGLQCFKVSLVMDCVEEDRPKDYTMNPDLLQKLRTFYKSHHQKLEQLMKKKYDWM